MVVAWHDAAFTTTELLLTEEILDRILEKFKLQHKLKSTWTRSEALVFEKMIDLDDSIVGHRTDQDQNQNQSNLEQDDLLEQISGQRMKLKQMREGGDSSKSE